jgi:hypothetical protein
LANEPDSEEPSASKPKRRPITIDLPAEEVGRTPASSEAAASSAASAEAAGPAAPEPASGPGQAPPDKASAGPAADKTPGTSADAKAAAGQEIPSAFATRKSGTGGPPPKWRPIDDPPPPRRSFAPILAGAIAGAAVAAIIVIALVLSGYLSPKSDDGLSAEIEALKGEVASLKQAGPDDGLASLQQQVAALEQKVGAAPASPAGPTEAQLKDVQDRVAALEQGGGEAGSVDKLKAQLAKLTEDIAALKNAVPADAASLESALVPVRERLDQLSTRIDELSTEVDAAPGEERVAAIEGKVDATAQKIDLAAALAPAVIADALDAAIGSGRPFSNELSALKNLGIGGDSVEQLGPDAEAGVATFAELRVDFDSQIAATDLTPTAPETTGTIDRLWQSAQGLVTVRPSHPTEGADPGAIVARIRGALDAGDLKRALKEWNTLPDTIKTPTSEWAGRAEARVKADDLVAAVRSEALSKLGAGQ